MKKKCEECIFVDKKNGKCSITNEKHYELEQENECISFARYISLGNMLEERAVLVQALFDLLPVEQQLAYLRELVFEIDSIRERIKGLVPQIREELKQKGVF